MARDVSHIVASTCYCSPVTGVRIDIAIDTAAILNLVFSKQYDGGDVSGNSSDKESTLVRTYALGFAMYRSSFPFGQPHQSRMNDDSTHEMRLWTFDHDYFQLEL